MQFDGARLSLIDCGQAGHRFVEFDHELVVVAVGNPLGVERHRSISSTPLQTPSTTGVLHQDLSHGPPGDREEVRAALIVDATPGELRVSLVYQFRRAQGVPRSFVAQLQAGERSQFVVYESEEIVERGRVSRAPRCQKPGDFRLHDAPFEVPPVARPDAGLLAAPGRSFA